MRQALAIILCASQCWGALTFGGATTDRCIVTTATSNQNFDPFTLLMWVYPTTLTANRRFIHRNTAGASNNYVSLNGTGGNLQLFVGRTGTDTSYITSSTPLSVTSQWYYVAVVYDSAAAAGEVVNMYTGSLTATAVEATYGTATDGTGTTEADSANNLVIGNNAGFGAAFQGRIGYFSYINKALTAAEVQSVQFRPRDWMKYTETKIFHVMGFSGTTTQVDWSGNSNSCAITGATVSNHVPLGPLFGFNIRKFLGIDYENHTSRTLIAD